MQRPVSTSRSTPFDDISFLSAESPSLFDAGMSMFSSRQMPESDSLFAGASVSLSEHEGEKSAGGGKQRALVGGGGRVTPSSSIGFRRHKIAPSPDVPCKKNALSLDHALACRRYVPTPDGSRATTPEEDSPEFGTTPVSRATMRGSRISELADLHTLAAVALNSVMAPPTAPRASIIENPWRPKVARGGESNRNAITILQGMSVRQASPDSSTSSESEFSLRPEVMRIRRQGM